MEMVNSVVEKRVYLSFYISIKLMNFWKYVM